MLKFLFAVAIYLATLNFPTTDGHGMVLEPVCRNSRWRYDNSAPINYEDNGLFCGGFTKQHTKNGGQCGLCGDDYSLSRPRPNEHGGRFGTGKIVRSYKSGGGLATAVTITANHFGYYYFQLCNMDKESESEACFAKYPLKSTTGISRFPVEKNLPKWANQTLVIPAGVTCKHCVLQWTYVTGNSWGDCEDGTGAIGCGKQETFRTCSDITIN